MDPITLIALAGASSILSIGMLIWYLWAMARLFPRIGLRSSEGWIPLWNDWKLIEHAGLPGWIVLLYFVPGVNIVPLVFRIIAMHRVGDSVGAGAGYTVLGVFIPPLWATLLGSHVGPVAGAGAGTGLGVAPQAAGLTGAPQFAQPGYPQPGYAQPGYGPGAPGGAAPFAGAPAPFGQQAAGPMFTEPPAPRAPQAPPAPHAPAAPHAGAPLTLPGPPAASPAGPPASVPAAAPQFAPPAAPAAPAAPVPPAPAPAAPSAPPAPPSFAAPAAPQVPAAPAPVSPVPVPAASVPPAPAPPAPAAAPGFGAPPAPPAPIHAPAPAADDAPLAAERPRTLSELFAAPEDSEPPAPDPVPAPVAPSGITGAYTSKAGAQAAGVIVVDMDDSDADAIALASVASAPATAPAHAAEAVEAAEVADAPVSEASAEDLDRTVLIPRRIESWVLELPDGTELVLGDDTVVGRRPEAPEGALGVAVADPTRTLSKAHARLRRVDGAWTVEDLASTNGVTLRHPDGSDEPLEAGSPATATEVMLFGQLEVRLRRAGDGS